MPQPVDMQTEVARTMMAERIQDAARAQLAAHQRARQEEEAERLRTVTQVTDAEETDGEHMAVREREEGQDAKREDSRSKPRKSAKEKKKRRGVDPDDHQLDVSV